MLTARDLRDRLAALDGKGYGAYRAIAGGYQYSDFELWIDRVQSDPFAAPSQVRVEVPTETAALPQPLYAKPVRAIATADYLTRAFAEAACQHSTRRGSGQSGSLAIAAVSQAILARTALQVHPDGRLTARFNVGLPARGRRILGRQAAELFATALPELVGASLCYPALPAAAVQAHADTAEDATALRQALRDRDLVAFVANGACLPRRSGDDDRPLTAGAIPFQAPPSLTVTLTCPHRGAVSGLGIPRGVTTIVGGGYHGKSTLLRALERGIYNHIPGDGRELVVADPTAMKIRAEDGRSVSSVAIAPFINNLPHGQRTDAFSTPNASGSTSQAANIVEALEAGARVLLLDEDTSATNFMVRDRRMQALIRKPQEPIAPFVDKVRQLYEELGVSTVLVMGGSGDYFDVADTAIALTDYQPWDATTAIREIAQRYPTGRQPEGGEQFGDRPPRYPQPESIDPSRGRRAVKVKARATEALAFGEATIDLSAVEQLLESNQVRAIAAALVYAKRYYIDGQRSLAEILQWVRADLTAAGLAALDPEPRNDWAEFRDLEFAAALNRLRSLQMTSGNLPDATDVAATRDDLPERRR